MTGGVAGPPILPSADPIAVGNALLTGALRALAITGPTVEPLND